MWPLRACPAQREVDASLSRERMLRGFQGGHTVIAQPARAAENDDVAMSDVEAQRPLLALHPAEQEHGRNAERDGHDRLAEVALVPVLMQGEARAGLVTIDEACVRRETRETGRVGRVARDENLLKQKDLTTALPGSSTC
jgi:hypothetical protein